MGELMNKLLPLFVVLLIAWTAPLTAKPIKINMVFVPASEKGDEKDYVNLIEIVNKLTGYEITPIRVTDYNAAVESMRADRAQIA